MIYKDINFDEFQKLSNNTILIDVRDVNEWKFGHLKNAHLLPLPYISIEKIQVLCQDLIKQNKIDLKQNINLVFYCRSGVRSIKAIHKIFDDTKDLIDSNVTINIFNLKNGIVGCKV